MTYLPPGNQDPYGQQPQPPQDPYSGQQPTQSNPYVTPPTQDPFSGQQSNPYAQPTAPMPASVPPAAPYGQAYGYPAAAPPQNSMALTSMILALVGIVTWITAPVGAILGHIALKQIRQTGESGEGMAKTGIIVGWIITGFGVLCCAGYIVFFVFLAANAENLSLPAF
jgi:Domain of unknown function (DUF4190)